MPRSPFQETNGILDEAILARKWIERWHQRGLLSELEAERLVEDTQTLHVEPEPANDNPEPDPQPQPDLQPEPQPYDLSPEPDESSTDPEPEPDQHDSSPKPEPEPDQHDSSPKPEPEPDEHSSSDALLDALEDPADSPNNAAFFDLIRVRIPHITTEGILWFIGIVLVLAGSLYFTKSNWSSWSPDLRATVVTCGLVLYQSLFVGLAAILGRRGAPMLPQRVLAGLGVGLVPMIGAGIQDLATRSILGAVLLGAISALVSFVAARPFDERLGPPIVLATVVSFLAAGGSETLVLGYASLLFLAGLCIRASRSLSQTPRTCLWVFFGYLAVAISARLVVPAQPYWIAPPIALVALTTHLLARDTRTLVRSQRDLTASSAPRIVVVVLTLLAIFIATTAPLKEISARVILLLTAGLSTIALLHRGWIDRRRLPFVLGIAAGLLTYFFLPAPFNALLKILLHSAKEALGYTEKPLPVAFYGLTFLPYLALWWWLRHRLASQRLSRAVGATLTVLSIGLCLLAFSSTDDARPVLFALPFYSAAFLIEARLTRGTFTALFATHLAGLMIAAWAARAGIALEPLWGIPLALALVSVLYHLKKRHVTAPWAAQGLIYAASAAIFAGLLAVIDASVLGAATLFLSSIPFALSAVRARRLRVATQVAAGTALVLFFSTPLLLTTTLLGRFAVISAMAFALFCLGEGLALKPRPDLSRFCAPARHLAPVAAVIAGLIALFLPNLPAFYLLPLTIVLAAAAWTTKRSFWILFGTIATLALSARLAVDLSHHPAWGALVAQLFLLLLVPLVRQPIRQLFRITTVISTIVVAPLIFFAAEPFTATRIAILLGLITAAPLGATSRGQQLVSGLAFVGLIAGLFCCDVGAFGDYVTLLTVVTMVAIACVASRQRLAAVALIGAVFSPLLGISNPGIAFTVVAAGSLGTLVLGEVAARFPQDDRSVLYLAVIPSALELAPCFALVAIGILIATGTIVSAGAFSLATVVFLLATITVGRSLWGVPALLTFSAFLALLFHDLDLPPALGLASAALLSTIGARFVHRLNLRTPRGDSLDWVFRIVSPVLSLVAGLYLITTLEPRPAVHLAAILCSCAFLVCGLRVLLGLALCLLSGALAWDLFLLLGAPLDIPSAFRLLGWLVLSAVCLNLLFGQWLKGRVLSLNLFRQSPDPSPAWFLAHSVLALMGVLLALLVGARAFPDGLSDGLFAMVATAVVWWAFRASRRRRTALLLSFWTLLLGATIGSFCSITIGAITIDGIPIGIVAASLILILKRHTTNASEGAENLKPKETLVFRVMAIIGFIASLFMTQLSTYELATPLVFGAITAAFLVRVVRRGRSFGLAIASLTITLSSCLFVVGRLLDTGRPPAAILPALALGYAALSLLLRFVANRAQTATDQIAQIVQKKPTDVVTVIEEPAARGRSVLLGLALTAVGLHLILLPQIALHSRLLSHGLLIFLLVSFIQIARRTGRKRFAILAEAALALGWLEIRRRSDLGGIPNIDIYALVLFTFLFAGVHTVVRRGPNAEAFEHTSRWSALILPVLAVLLVPHDVSWNTSLVVLMISVAYGVVARLKVSKLAAPLATAALNFSLLLAWLTAGVTDPQLYALPIGLSLLFLGYLYRAELSDNATIIIRLVALAIVYLASFCSVLTFDTPHHGLVMACICVGGVIGGAILRIKSYLFLGAGFLLLDLAINIIRFGLTGQTAATIVLTAMGLMVLGAMVFWSINRVAVIRSYERFTHELMSWQT